jgi:hypothetical protein
VSETQNPEYVLPPALIGRADLARLVREIENIDAELEAQRARARSTGETGYHLPMSSQGLSDFLELNEVDIADDQTRMKLKEGMRRLKDHAPVMHLTFAVDADPEFLGKLVAWLRQEIHPQALISVGLQPSLVGGVYVRTPNHIHDYSIRSLLATKRDIMVHELESLTGAH